jgi:hypothetical protein
MANKKLNGTRRKSSRGDGSIRKEGASIYLGRNGKRAMVKIDGMPLFAIPEGTSAEAEALRELGVR